MAHDCDPTTFGYILAWTIGLEIAGGVLVSDDATVATIEQAVVAAEKSSNDNAVMLAEYSLGVALTHRDSASERERGIELLEGTLVMLKTRVPSLVSVTELWVARERARGGDGAVISAMRQAVDDMIDAGRIGYCVFGSATLVETLLDRGEGDGLIAAQEVIERLENLGVQHDVAMLKVTVLRLRAMLAGIRDEDGAYLKLASEYRAMAESLGFEGHIRWAKAMTDS